MLHNSTRRAYLELHIAVVLFGFTAILGDLIQLSATVLVWWRVLITCLSLLAMVRLGKLLRELPRRMILTYMGIGILVAAHWVTFYGSIKLSNASVSLICLGTTSFFAALLEPLILRQRVKKLELMLGLLIVPGMLLVVNGVDQVMLPGVVSGLASALLAATFAILNKRYIKGADVISITLLELGGAFLILSGLLPVLFLWQPDLQWWPLPGDWGYLLVLSLLCTTLAYILSLRALRYLSAFASTLTINLEPVYGILLAWWLLGDHEELSSSFYLGGGFILMAVFMYPWLKRYQRRRRLRRLRTLRQM